MGIEDISSNKPQPDSQTVRNYSSLNKEEYIFRVTEDIAATNNFEELYKVLDLAINKDQVGKIKDVVKNFRESKIGSSWVPSFCGLREKVISLRSKEAQPGSPKMYERVGGCKSFDDLDQLLRETMSPDIYAEMRTFISDVRTAKLSVQAIPLQYGLQEKVHELLWKDHPDRGKTPFPDSDYVAGERVSFLMLEGEVMAHGGGGWLEPNELTFCGFKKPELISANAETLRIAGDEKHFVKSFTMSNGLALDFVYDSHRRNAGRPAVAQVRFYDPRSAIEGGKMIRKAYMDKIKGKVQP